MRLRKLRWYWAAPAVFYGVRVWREDGPWWAAAMVVGGLLVAAFGIWRHRNDPPNPPRFEAKAAWPELPVQPPSGTWQRSAHLLNATLAANLVLVLVMGFVARANRSPNHNIWSDVVIWSLIGALVLQALVYIVVWVRGQQLLRRELRLGYTTWTGLHVRAVSHRPPHA
jgi:hypothetical protein